MKNGGIIFILFVCSMCLAHGSRVKNITHGVSRHIRSIGFPEGSGMGIFFALGVPLDIPNKSILFSYYFEANYGLPGDWNSSYYTEVEHLKKKRNLDRRLAYDIISKQLESNGYSRQDCLLKTICEVAKYSLNGNGLLGDIIRILFAPSSSQDENLPNEIIEAEFEENCNRRYKDCAKSLLDIISPFLH
ncbi:PREDICTED: uncharacterized protein LOC107069729 [Polistes dominula]|uniref:Uncharacterized protein LOC107069729 n=1 Tax=Polistes dominula TaxID=743375 RepID=A0ABM1IRC3_POLDO|nr:PREDICTED: uncharacterized protein LOC107069729 [Polistes dominula]